jgi:DNA ligase-1
MSTSPASALRGQNKQPESSASFSAFVATADAIAGASRRLEKASLLGAFFAALGDEDLPRGARYFAGDVFAMRDERRLNVGGALVLGALEEASGREPAELRRLLVKLGDLGDVAGRALPDRRLRPAFSLRDAERFFADLVELRGSLAKRRHLREQLERLSPAEARYLVKLALGDLRIGLREGAVEDALARRYARPVPEVQWANMLTGDIGETALLARRGRLTHASMRLFHPIKFMLASPAGDAAEVRRLMQSGFAIEDKFDGIRAQAHVAPGRVALYSRTLDEVSRSFPELVPELAKLARDGRDCILDGEIVPLKDGKILSFQELQQRLGRKTVSEELLARVPAGFVVFDVLYSAGRILLNRPYSERRVELEEIPLERSPRLIRAYSKIRPDPGELDAELAAARARGNEGLMVKSLAAPYKPGRRGKDWLKIKRAQATLDVVVTSVEVGNGRRRHLLSDFTFAVRASADDPTLLNVGKAYSGLTDAELETLSAWFRNHTLQEFAHGKVRLVEPKVVLEVAFDRVQPSKRHKGGFALRFPRILRIREDKSPEEIDTLESVRKLVTPG